MSTPFTQRVTVHPPVSVPRRMLGSMWRQGSRCAVCPPTPKLVGEVAFVTGGSRGIGLETTRGLASRGAETISASRGEAGGLRCAEAIRGEFGVPSHFVPLDLSDVTRIPYTLDQLADVLGGRRLSIFIANAGLWPMRYGVSAQGHEIAFATNVLGHHALLRGALERGLLADRARVIFVTGDIYILTKDCTSDFTYRGALGGQTAYCRSKLGNVWDLREWARRHPELRAHVVHPGVIASELGSGGTVFGAVKRLLMLPPEQGAQTSLFCATQPDLETGTYYHNTLGRMALHPDDPAADDAKAAALWERLEDLCGQAGLTGRG